MSNLGGTSNNRGQAMVFSMTPMRSWSVPYCSVKLPCLLLLSLAACAALANAADSQLPQDVDSFIATREDCDHWRGEDPYDKEREAEINWNVCQTCLGTDEQLASLKKKYANNAAVISVLSEFELKVEPNPRQHRVFCSSLKRPPEE